MQMNRAMRKCVLGHMRTTKACLRKQTGRLSVCLEIEVLRTPISIVVFEKL